MSAYKSYIYSIPISLEKLFVGMPREFGGEKGHS